VEPTIGKENDPNKKKGGGKHKGNGQDNGGGRKHENKLANNNQAPKFKMRNGEMREKISSASVSTNKQSGWHAYVPTLAHKRVMLEERVQVCKDPRHCRQSPKQQEGRVPAVHGMLQGIVITK
jgi:hypothetical protein